VELSTDRESSVTRTRGSRSTAAQPADRALITRSLGKPRAAWGILPFLAKAIGALVLTTVVGLGLLYVRLLYGPIVLTFLVQPIERAIADEFQGPRVHIESVALSLNDRGLFQFELKNVRVSDAGGETLVTAPSVAVSLSRRAMLRGRIAVESLDLVSARLVLFYADDGTLALKFSPAPKEPEAPGSQPPPGGLTAPSAPPAAPPDDGDGTLGRIDLVKVLSEASARARRGENAGAFLREIGLRSATVIIDNGRRKATWHVPELDVDLDHRRTRSSVAGRAKIESATGPWELTFRSYQHVNNKALNLSLSVQGLVPRELAPAFPHLSVLEGFDLPVSGEVRLDLSSVGEILGGKIVIEAAAGNLALPGASAGTMRIGSGRVELTYDAAARSFEIAPSSLAWGDGRVQFAGTIVHAGQGADGPRWTFDVKSTEGALGADGQTTLPIDQLTATGYFAPEHGRIVLDRLLVRAGGTEISAQGEVADASGVMRTRLEGKIGAMPVSLFKTLWPAWFAPETRNWVSTRLTGGDLQGGTFKLVRGTEPANRGWTPVSDGDRMTFALEGANLEFALLDGLPPLRLARALLRIEGPIVELSAPEASVAVADGRKFALKGTFSVDLSQPLGQRKGTLALKGQGPLSLAIELLDRQAPHVLKNSGLALGGSDGKVDASLNITLPLVPQMGFNDAAVEGRLRVSDASIRQAFGTHDVQGINVSVDLSASAIEAKGKFLVGNVPATVSWQYVYGAAPDKQPPLRIATVLYENERTELGIDVNDLVRGEVAAEITVVQDAQGERHVHVRADLTNAELTLDGLAWSKPVGERGVFEFDVVKGTKYPVEMHNVRLDAENVAIAGWMGAGPDFRVKEYRFPQFSLNVVSNFEASGKLRADNVWEVTAKGATYDGRDLFRSFFNPVPEKAGKNRPGIDLRAEFDTVLGFHGTSLRTVRVLMQKRAGRMTQLDARGTMVDARGKVASGKQLEAALRPEASRPRLLVATANDAGLAFKLVGFLPHAVGGEMNLEVNLDGKGAIERAGRLQATQFHLLGDEVPPDPFQDPGTRRRTGVREMIPFNILQLPFSVGQGQFMLKDARLEGPVFSATGTGKIDFKTKRVQVSGTFTPAAGVNQMFRDIPLLGELLSGPKGEGMFAWNFALQGGLQNPQITFNPLSGIAPGFTRDFFPILPEEPRTPPRKGSSRDRAEPGARASSSLAKGPSEADEAASGDISEGWLSEKAWSTKRK
jgi:AsmA-like C-terminal region